jgi:hypothetical protein
VMMEMTIAILEWLAGEDYAAESWLLVIPF